MFNYIDINLFRESMTKYPNGLTIFEALSTVITSFNSYVEEINDKVAEGILETDAARTALSAELNDLFSVLREEYQGDFQGLQAEVDAAVLSVNDKVSQAQLDAVSAQLAEKANYDKTTGTLNGAYVPVVTYQHPRGDSEMEGNGSYSQQIIGFSELMEKATVFNKLILPMYHLFVNSYVDYKIFIRDSGGAFTPSNEIPIAEGTLTANETNHAPSKNQTILLEKPLSVPAGKYLIVLIKSSSGTVAIKKWDANSGTAPFRHGFYFNTNNNWITPVSVGGGTFQQTAIKLLFEITSEMLRDSKPNWNKELALPPYIYAVVGKTMNVYLDNLVSDDIENYYVDVICSKGKHYANRWEYTPTVAETLTLTIELYDKYMNLVKTASTTVVSVLASANTGVSKTCLFIGDSLTAAGTYTNELLNLLGAGDPMDITLIGSQGVAPNKHEGYGGRTVNWMCADASSPFVVSGAFNFTQYMINKGYSAVDVVFIFLGINDVFAQASDVGTDYVIDDNKIKINAMITSIKVFNPNAKIALMVPTPPSKSQDAFGDDYDSGQSKWRAKRNIHRYAKALISAFSGMTASNIYIVPTNVNLDTVNNVAMTSVPVNSRNTSTYWMQSNGVHPQAIGYYQIADTVYYFLKNLT